MELAKTMIVQDEDIVPDDAEILTDEDIITEEVVFTAEHFDEYVNRVFEEAEDDVEEALRMFLVNQEAGPITVVQTPQTRSNKWLTRCSR